MYRKAVAPALHPPKVARILAYGLAIAATGVSVCLSIIAAWERGGWIAERLVWVAISVVLLLCAHLLPALIRYTPRAALVPAAILWFASVAATSYGHVTFFLLAQQHAGAVRASAVAAPAAIPVAAGQTAGAIALQRATVTAELARIDTMRCTTSCASLQARRTALLARRDALDIELHDAERRERAEDRAAVQQEAYTAARMAAVSDPVTDALALLVQTSATRIDLAVGIAFGLILEIAACFAWFMALPATQVRAASDQVSESHEVVTGSQNRPQSLATQAVISHSLTLPGSTPDAEHSEWSVAEPLSDKVRIALQTDVSPELAQVISAVKSGACAATTNSIRDHLRVGQEKAARLRRELGELLPEYASRRRRSGTSPQP